MARLRSRGFLPSHLLSRLSSFLLFVAAFFVNVKKRERKRRRRRKEATFLCSTRRKVAGVNLCGKLLLTDNYSIDYIDIVRSSTHSLIFVSILISFHLYRIYNLKQKLDFIKNLFRKTSLKRNN